MNEERDHANVVILPPVALALTVGLAWLAGRFWPLPFLPDPLPHLWPGVALIALGFAMELWALVLFHRAGTNPLPTRPTTAVIEAGPYRFSRNPIYVGMLLSVIGAAVALNSLWQFAALAILYAIIRWGVVAREEAYLTRKFGAPYTDYAARVRRWL